MLPLSPTAERYRRPPWYRPLLNAAFDLQLKKALRRIFYFPTEFSSVSHFIENFLESSSRKAASKLAC
jgi:hypothetical protein